MRERDTPPEYQPRKGPCDVYDCEKLEKRIREKFASGKESDLVKALFIALLDERKFRATKDNKGAILYGLFKELAPGFNAVKDLQDILQSSRGLASYLGKFQDVNREARKRINGWSNRVLLEIVKDFLNAYSRDNLGGEKSFYLRQKGGRWKVESKSVIKKEAPSPQSVETREERQEPPPVEESRTARAFASFLERLRQRRERLREMDQYDREFEERMRMSVNMFSGISLK